MALIEWTESYSVNVKQFDQHHQHLFDLINSLHDSMRLGQGRKVIGETLDALVDYTDKHFNAEEEVMRRTGYAGMAAHIEQHKAFRAKAHELARRQHSGGGVVTQEVLDFMRDWLKTHIQRTDRAYTQHMQSSGVN